MTEPPQIQIQTPITINTKNVEEDLIITGIASTTNKDLQNEVMTKEAIQSMQKQVVGLNLHIDHNHDYDGAIGVITDATITEKNELIITAKVFPTYAKDIRERLEFGMNLGLSIGGFMERNPQNPQVIKDIKLLEVSLTPIPANNDSYGSVQIVKGVVVSDCFGKACNYVLKKYNGEKMVEEENKNNEQEETEETEEIQKAETEQVTEETIINLFNELMAEKEQVIIEELSSKMENKIEMIVKNYLEAIKPSEETEEEVVVGEESEVEKEVTDSEEKEEVTEEETTTEEETEEDEEEEKVEKSITKPTEPTNSKFDIATKSIQKQNTFLDSETRDIFGRNKKYL